MTDSTPDSSHREIYSLVIRYVDDNLTVHERVLALKELPSKTGQTICDFILDTLRNYHISTDRLIGQCYDNAPNMAGCRRGVQNCMKVALKRDIIHIPCGGHSANLAVKHSCECATEYICFFDLIEEIYKFFTGSIKRYHILRTQVDSSSSALSVKNLSITRWSANYASVNSLYRSVPEINNTFNIIIDYVDDKELNGIDDRPSLDDKKARQQVNLLMIKTSTDGTFFFQSINLQKKFISFEFTLLLHFINLVTQQTQNLTEHLQKKSLDLVTASHLLFNTNKVLLEWRNDDVFLEQLIKVSQ
jgi:hypothetical protein